MPSGKRAKAGYHYDGGVLPFVLYGALRVIAAHVRTGRACTPLARCNSTLDFVPKFVCQGAKPLRIPAERVRTYAEKWQNFTISGCSFIGEYGILGLVQQIRICEGNYDKFFE